MVQCLLLSTDLTLTLENVSGVMEKVSVDKRKQVWEKVLGEEAVEEIYSDHSSEERNYILVLTHTSPNLTHPGKTLLGGCIGMVKWQQQRKQNVSFNKKVSGS